MKKNQSRARTPAQNRAKLYRQLKSKQRPRGRSKMSTRIDKFEPELERERTTYKPAYKPAPWAKPRTKPVGA